MAWPQPQTDLCHGSHRHGLRTADLAEAVQQSDTDMQLHNLALKHACRHALTQPLESMHLRLHKAAPVVAAPLLPDAAAQALARANGLVA